VMNLLMGATPLAMQICSLPYSSAALVVEWHIIGMFAPALIAGSLVHRFGPLRIMIAGVGTFFLCILSAVTGQTVTHFWLSGTLLGIGWCFLYVGATTLLTEAYAPAEKARVQGMNDLLVYVIMASSSAISGAILYLFGWSVLNYAALPLVLCTGVAILWFAASRRTRGTVHAAVPSILE